jgi:hypothetical protein
LFGNVTLQNVGERQIGQLRLWWQYEKAEHRETIRARGAEAFDNDA